MNISTCKRLGRLIGELAVLLAIYFLGCQLAVWLAWPIPGGVVGLGLLLVALWRRNPPHLHAEKEEQPCAS